MDIQLNKEQLKYRQDMIDFAKKYLNDPNDKEIFSRKAWNDFSEFGWFGLNILEKDGGLGENNVTCATVIEAMGYSCQNNGFSFVVNNHWWMAQNLIYLFGSERLKQKYINNLMNGCLIGAFALTEADAGSDSNAIQTKAILEKDEYILNGSKTFISNGPIADIFIVFAVTQEAPIKKITAFVIERAFEGVSTSNEIKKMGLDSSPTGEVVFQNCRVPAINILGELHEGNQIMMSALEYERFYEFFPHIGAMQRVMESCIQYSQERRQFGKYIADFQGVSHKIADMSVRIEMARAMMYHIARLKDMGKNTYSEASIFKLYVSESYVQTCKDALQIHGAYGYTKEYSVERELRDALASTIYSGTSEIQRDTIFRITSSSIWY